MDRPSPPYFPPPPPVPAKLRAFQRVPPAIFPMILGLLGLGLAWRAGHDLFGFPAGPAELFLGVTSLIFLFSLAAYAAKIIRRPGVVIEDARSLSGRAGLAALSMGIMLLAATLVPYAPAAASIILLAGFGLHTVLALHVLTRLIRAPEELGPTTPGFYMVFVGFVVSPICAIELGQDVFVLSVLTYSCAVTLIICALTLPSLLRKTEPAPLRPLHAIHLAPAAMITTIAALTDLNGLAITGLIWSSVLFLILLWRLAWILEAGFSGFWSAFTFPLTAYAGCWIAVYFSFGWETARIAGGIGVVLSTLVVLPIALRILRLWADGTLAAKTNAAIA